MRHVSSLLILLVPVLGLAAALFAGCGTTSNKASLTIQEVMNEGFKGKTSLAARLTENLGTEADKMRMVYLTQQLALNAPPKGDLTDWTERTAQLNRAAVALESQLPDSLEVWKAAADCKACHTLHKPDKEPGSPASARIGKARALVLAAHE